ncbi:MAG: 5-formyltetrahydrofolate cyclo-ligase [Maricaulaceae bacterium]|nr:5-formyltetrahydrofolate cyclo-ligase [Maricaulaceae bacterium]
MFLRWRKSRARRAAFARRARARAAAPDAARALVANFPDDIWPAIGSVVAGYHPIGDEIDPRPLLETFHCEQARLALPCMQGKGRPLAFRQWLPGDELVKAAFGVMEPAADRAELRPALVLVPLLAADRAGNRLGYGQGYYDRTLAFLRAQGPVVAAGLAYDGQLAASVPAGRHDQRLDWLITEKRAYRCGQP